MIGGNTRVNLDVPPYFLYSDFNVTPIGLNIVGLRRERASPRRTGSGAERKTRIRFLYKSGLKLDDALSRIETESPTEHTRHLVAFVRSSKSAEFVT